MSEVKMNSEDLKYFKNLINETRKVLFSEINDFRFKQVADKMNVVYIFAGKFRIKTKNSSKKTASFNFFNISCFSSVEKIVRLLF